MRVAWRATVQPARGASTCDVDERAGHLVTCPLSVGGVVFAASGEVRHPFSAASVAMNEAGVD